MELKLQGRKFGSGNLVFARIFIMTPDIRRSVAAAYQLKIQAHQISQVIKYTHMLQLKSLGFYLI